MNNQKNIMDENLIVVDDGNNDKNGSNNSNSTNSNNVDINKNDSTYTNKHNNLSIFYTNNKMPLTSTV
jgi:hypothetical protein